MGEREKENNEPILNRDNSKERKERNKDKTRDKERKWQRDQHLSDLQTLQCVRKDQISQIRTEKNS